ncbi:FHA domain-containing protein [Candidatus Ozemobacteraceae bacterium]|nr:FHA domain-containing protein [Candidatus Ozemobacteraceae bacterium]
MTRRTLNTLIIIICFAAVNTCLVAQTLSGPAESDPGALFVVDVSVPAGAGPAWRLSFDPATVQFMGLVSPTPEVQLSGDSLLEITPDNGKSSAYQVKFLPFPNASSADFMLGQNAGGGSKLHVAFVAKVEEKQYHFHVLGGGILLLFVAWAVWRYQKKNPGLMSTRSLFLNFEELQKAREQFFADHPASPSSDASSMTPEPRSGSNMPSAVPPAADSTQEMPAVNVVPEPTEQQPPLPRAERTLEMPFSVSKTEQKDVPKVPAAMSAGESDTPSGASDTVQSPMEQQKQPSGETGETAEMPVVDVKEEKPAAVFDISNKTVARSGISGKIPAVDSTVDMPGTPQPLETASSSDKTISRSGFLRQSEPGPAAASIIVKLTDENGRVFEGRGVEVLIGRAKECNISMTAAEVSRRHLLIRRERDGFAAVPQTTSNVTEINGVPVKAASEIRSGDKLSLGGTAFTIEITI